jgi:cytochrome oxidase assembly protein ShyY1
MTGEFHPEEEVLLRSQVYLGRPGFDVLTPMYVDETTAVLVNRGWVPLEMETVPVAGAAPPAGRVEVEGFVRHPLQSDTRERQISIVARVDLASLDSVVQGELAGFYLELTSIEASDGMLPIIDNAPDLSDGPHLSYAIQWFAFALVSVVGYGALIRSTVRRRSGLNRREAPQPPLPS